MSVFTFVGAAFIVVASRESHCVWSAVFSHPRTVFTTVLETSNLDTAIWYRNPALVSCATMSDKEPHYWWVPANMISLLQNCVI